MGLLLITDILPTGYEIGVLNGDVKDGDTVAVIGVGPVGLAAVMTARMKGASKIIAVNRDEFRLQTARDFGATDTITLGSGDPVEQLKALTDDGLGVDVAIEAVGVPVADHCHERGPARRDDREHRGARSAGGASLQNLWIHNITLRTGLVSGTTIPELLNGITTSQIAPERFATHRFKLSDINDAYDVFGNAAKHQAIKVVLTA